MRQPREAVSQPCGVSGGSLHAQDEAAVLASPGGKPASAGRIYSLSFEPARRALVLFRQVADALPGHGAALGWALPPAPPACGQAGRDLQAAWPRRGESSQQQDRGDAAIQATCIRREKSSLF